MKWPLIPVSEITKQVRGVSYDKSQVSNNPSQGLIPILRAGNIQDGSLLLSQDLVFVPESCVSAQQLLRPGDIVIAASSGSLDVVGKAAQIQHQWQGSFGAFCKVVRPASDRIDPRYLHHFFQSSGYRRKISSLAAGANINNLKNEHIDDLVIPLPPLEEQRRIAAILDKCNAIQAADRKRRETISRFQVSYFRHLFGEPSTASENWPLKTVESCSAAIQTGPFGSLLHQSDYIQGGIPILNPKHIVNGVIACGENETIGKDKAGELIGYQLKKGDILLARRGEMGRCAVLTSKEDGWLCGTGSMFIRPLGGTLAPEYLCALLSSEYMRSKLEKIAIGTTLLNLNAKIVGDLLIPVPPIDLQHRYADVLARLSALGDMTTLSALARSTATAAIQSKLLSAAGS
jgi:type I restriction enzyme S subunit